VAKNLPFFAYGTLLPGQPNYPLWQAAILNQRPATFPNGRLHDVGPYPILLEGGDNPVKGMVIDIAPAAYATILTRLDYLEGYNPAAPDDCTFCRVVRPVNLTDTVETIEAWVYLGQTAATTHLPLIESGDWPTHATAKLTAIANWWQGITTVK
jgi:gamma-glutamylcyclotransferase (GGCT)/AIG2-like uncharacterized protein YtfP